MQITNGDVALDVVEDGDPAAPPVLFLHGITAWSGTWSWIVPLLADRYRVLRLDFRGHGRSGRAPGAYTPEHYLSDAVAVCEQAIGVPAVVVGHSLGGGAAAALAQRRPDLVRAVVLEDPALGASSDVGENSLLDVFALMRQMIPQVQESGIGASELAATLASMPGATGVALGEQLHEDALQAMAAGLLLLDATVLDVVIERRFEPAFDMAAPLDVPGVLLAADPASPDAVVRAPQLEALARTSPRLHAWPVAGATHLVHDATATRQTMLAAVQGVLAGLG